MGEAARAVCGTLSAQLWSTHQLDAFRKASNDYADRFRSAVPPEPPPIPRLGITVIGQGVTYYEDQYFVSCAPTEPISPASSLRRTCASYWMQSRTREGPSNPLWPLVHRWRGCLACELLLACVSYKALEPARAALLRKMQERNNGRDGPRSATLSSRPDATRGSRVNGQRRTGRAHNEVFPGSKSAC